MRNTPNVKAERYRLRDGLLASHTAYGNNGAFMVPVGKTGTVLTVIASDEDAWDHVSVSLSHRLPTWEEMTLVKDLFFREDEWVVQYHPATKDYVNYHKFCLHLWRPQQVDLPRPPSWLVGPLAPKETP